MEAAVAGLARAVVRAVVQVAVAELAVLVVRELVADLAEELAGLALEPVALQEGPSLIPYDSAS